MILYKWGEVILIPFPFTDLSTTKQRPALVISSNWFNESRNDVVLAAITSHIPPKSSRDEYRLSPAEQKSADLPKPSIVKLGKIVTIDQRLIRKKLGRVPNEMMLKINECLKEIFGYS
ncbi:MAG: type II toxin-antitoxin system PemK/MazF family toxin [Methanocellales archaeon]|nr:type II toxin-antitoxin system PemK/MazF family toxin [Methanocellales archaeon]